MASTILAPFPFFTESDGSALENGYIYIGTASLDAEANPVAVYWDSNLTVSAGQPIRTVGGVPARNGTPANVYVSTDDYSLVVRDKNSTLVMSALNAANLVPSSIITYNLGYTGTVSRTLTARLGERVSIKDFGAVGDGVTNDTTAVAAALAYIAANGGDLYFPNGETYVVNSAQTLTLTADTRLIGHATIEFSVTNGVGLAVSPAGHNFFVGGGLTFDGNNVTRWCMTVEQNSTSANKIEMDDVSFINSYQTTNSENGGLMVRGGFDIVSLRRVDAINHTRILASTGGTAGLIVTEYTGDFARHVIVDGCLFKDITNNETSGTAVNADVDGLKIFSPDNDPDYCLGSASVTNCKFLNCKGRGIKIQSDMATVTNCSFYRNIAGCLTPVDINAQFAAGLISCCTMLYEDSISGEATHVRECVPVAISATRTTDRMCCVSDINVMDNTTTGNLGYVVEAYTSGTEDVNVITSIVNVHAAATAWGFVRTTPMQPARDPYKAITNIKNCYVKELLYGLVGLTSGSAQWNLNQINVDGFMHASTAVKSCFVTSATESYANCDMKFANTIGILAPSEYRYGGYTHSLFGKIPDTDTTLAITGFRAYSCVLEDEDSVEIELNAYQDVGLCSIHSTYGKTACGIFAVESTGTTVLSEFGSSVISFGGTTNPDDDTKLNLWYTGNNLWLKNRLGDSYRFTVSVLG